jgi:hypothetical protein
MVSNLDRSEWAAAALRHFQCITGTDWEDSGVCSRNGFLSTPSEAKVSGFHGLL